MRRTTSSHLFLKLLTLCVAILGAVTAHGASSPSVTKLALSSGSVPAGTSVTLTASVGAGGAPVSRGLVLFCDAAAPHCMDIHLLGLAQLTKNGTASIKLRMGIGEHTIKAEFQGTRLDANSTSAAESLSVTGKIVTDTNISRSGFSFAGVVTSHGALPAAGTVSFLDVTNGNDLLASAPLNAGRTGVLFATAPAVTVGMGPIAMVSADFNGDGVPDLAVGNFSGRKREHPARERGRNFRDQNNL